ncbi:alpha/beta-hydrolase [Xylariomycetidae sp. FL0641]|nr:alpha/beta-hydrolase [Xylariomycetidae sp. FL0641]
MALHKTDADSPPPQEQERHWLMGDAAFQAVMPHHASLRALWETKWALPCSKSLYPFHDGAAQDFAPIFRTLIASGVDSGSAPAYTRAFLPAAAALEAEGDKLLAAGAPRQASDVYLRAAAVLRIARFPYVAGFPAVTDHAKWDAWTRQKEVYMKAARTWDAPVEDLAIPHTHRAGRDRGHIPVYVRVPADRSSVPDRSQRNRDDDDDGPRQCPAVLLLTGLDGYRPDNTARCNEFLARGWGVVVAEIPGTADCPADSADPAAPDRLWASVLAWMRADGRFDMRRLLAWGLSAGGYYAVRLAHTHAGALAGAVAQGAGVHLCYGRAWMARAEGHEYPFALAPAMAAKHGFASVAEYREAAQARFSLLESGILERKSCRLLLVNGTLDGLMPIEDSMLLFEHGSPKEARFFPGALHMGYPLANASVYPWMEEVLASVK